MRRPGSDFGRQRLDRLSQSSTDPHKDALRAAVRERLSDAFQLEFLENTEKKMLRGFVCTLAAASVRAVHGDLDRRRAALRQLLLEDGLRLEEEELDRAARAVVDRLDEARTAVDGLKALRQQEQQQLVLEKRQQQDRAGLDLLRSIEASRNTVLCKQVNLGQARDRRDLQEAEREQDKLFATVQAQMLEAQVAREEQEAREELARKAQLCQVLQLQVRERQERADAQQDAEHQQAVQQLQRVREELRLEKEAEAERVRKQREELRLMYAEQRAQRQREVARAADLDAAQDEELVRRARAALDVERKELTESTGSKARLAAETRMYLSYQAASRRRQQQDEREEEAARQAEVLRGQRAQDARRCAAQAARQKMLQDVLAARAGQLQEAQLQQQQERLRRAQQQQQEDQVRVQQLQLATQHRQRLQQEKQQYAADLKAQLRHNQLLQARQLAEQQRQAELAAKDEEEYAARVQFLISSSSSSSSRGVHPFRLKVEGRALQWPE